MGRTQRRRAAPRSRRQRRSQRGGKLFDVQNLLNKTGIEFHWPGYQHMEPGTHLKKRLARVDPGINRLDRIAKAHDIDYDKAKNFFCFFSGSRFVRGWLDPGVSMIQFQQSGGTHVRQRTQLSERGLLVLTSLGTTVPLLLHNSLAVPVVMVPIQVAYLGQMLGGSVTVASQPVRLTDFSNLLWCRDRFGWTGGLEFFLGRPPFTLLSQQSLFVFEVPLVLCLFRLLEIFVGHLDQH